MPAVLTIFFGAGLAVASCWCCGKLLLARLDVDLYSGEVEFFRFTAGAACFSLLIFLLTALHLAYPIVFLAASALVLVSARLWASDRTRRVSLPDFSTFWKVIFLLCFGAFGLLYLTNAAAPEISPDGTTYHLGLVGRYLRQHAFGRITTNFYGNLSEAIEMLFLFAFTFGRHSAAALVEFSFLLALPLGMVAYARRFGFAKAGVTSALLIFVSPVFGIAGTSAYNDAAAACVLFALFYGLQIWSGDRKAGWPVVVGLLAGFGYGIKYTLFLGPPYAAIYFMWKLRRGHRPLARPLATFTACAALMISPWLVKNAIVARNPFSPFFNGVFPNPVMTSGFERTYLELMRVPDQFSSPQRPLLHTVKGSAVGGFLGPTFLLLPLALLSLRYSRGRLLLLTGLLFWLPALTNVQTRFLMYGAPFLCLALGLALAEAPGAALLVVVFHAFTSWPSFAAHYSDPWAWRLKEFPVRAALRLESQTAFLHRRLPEVAIAEVLDRFVPPGGRVFAYSNPVESYSSREVIVAYQSSLGQRLGEELWAACIPDYAPTSQINFRFHRQTLKALRLVERGASPFEHWSVAELRLLRGSEELSSRPAAQVSAWPNPFAAPLAFDGALITRWSSDEPMRRGMFLQVDLQNGAELDQVLVIASHGQDSSHLRLEGRISPETFWKLLDDEPVRSDITLPLDLRRGAIRNLSAHGVTHLLIDRGDQCSGDFLQRASDWGIVHETAAFHSQLYRLLP